MVVGNGSTNFELFILVFVNWIGELTTSGFCALHILRDSTSSFHVVRELFCSCEPSSIETSRFSVDSSRTAVKQNTVT